MRGVDEMQTAAKQSGIFSMLQRVILFLGYSQGRHDNTLTPDEYRLQGDYRSAEFNVIQPFGEISYKNQQWMDTYYKYHNDLWLLDEVMKKYFTPDLRKKYYAAVKGIAPTANEKPPTGSTLQPTDAEFEAAKKATVAQPPPKPTTVTTSPANSSTNPSAEDLIAQGSKYWTAYEYAKGAEAYQKAIALKPSSMDAHQGLGLCYYFLKEYREALTEFQEAARLKPDLGINYYWVGVTEMKIAGEKDREPLTIGLILVNAVDALEKAVRLEPGNVESQFQLGNAYFKSGHPEKSVKPFNEAIRLDPKYVVTYYNLGFAYVTLGRKNKAMQVYQKLLTLDKKEAQELLAEINKVK